MLKSSFNFHYDLNSIALDVVPYLSILMRMTADKVLKTASIHSPTSQLG